jgi:hypothetical protein
VQILWRTKGEDWSILSFVGGERASTVRQVRSGKVCALCRRPLPQPHTAGEQLCAMCRAASGRHRVYMSYMQRDGWHCHFLEPDLKTAVREGLHFRSDQKIREIAERGGCNMNLEARQSLDHGIEIGRGGVWLELTEEQYRRLKERA